MFKSEKRHEVPGHPAKTETCSHHSNLCHGAAHTVHWSNVPCSVFWPDPKRSSISFNFSSPKIFSRRDVQQQDAFNKQCRNGLPLLRIRHLACLWIFVNPACFHLEAPVCYHKGSRQFRTQPYEPALTAISTLSHWKKAALFDQEQAGCCLYYTHRAQTCSHSSCSSCCAPWYTGTKPGLLAWRQSCTRGVLSADLMGLFQSRFRSFKTVRSWIHNESKKK